MDLWWIVAMVSGILFALGSVYYALIRIPRWRRMTVDAYVADFGQAVRVADRIQPLLALIAIVATIAYAISSSGTTQLLAIGAVVVYGVIIAASVGVIVPLQRRIIAAGGGDPAMRQRWFRGHWLRTALAGIAVLLLGAAGAVATA
jgi:hypothetical protein